MANVTKPKFDYYETDQYIVVNVLVKKMDSTYVSVKFEPRQMSFHYKPQCSTGDQNESIIYELVLNLNGQIHPQESSYRLSPVKLEIKLRKVANFRWGSLESSSNKPSVPVAMNSVTNTEDSSAKTQNKSWDQLVKEIENEEKEDGGVEDLFRKIYSSGDDELRKAMNKSFVESNGTVLSTNWNEVSQKKVDMKPPDSCEFKEWN